MSGIFTHIRFQHSKTKQFYDAYPGILGFRVGAVWTIKDVLDPKRTNLFEGDQEALIQHMIEADYNNFEWRA